MNDKAQTAAPAAETSAESPAGEQRGEDPSYRSGTPSTGLFHRLSGLFRPRNGTSLREDLTDALSESASVADFSPGERAMLNNILKLREVRVEDVMVPRTDVRGVDISTSLGDLIVTFDETGHSRVPVYAETLDDPRGMIHIRDVLGYVTKAARQRRPRRRGEAEAQPSASSGASALDLGRVDLARPIGELSIVRPILFVPPSMMASDLMARMQAARIQMALVIDEYGGTDGLVSLEDLVEVVVGDIEDEHDEDEALIRQTDDGAWIVDGKAEISDVSAAIGSTFSAGDHEEDVDTIGGLLFNELGRVPARGEVVQAVPGFEFQVLDADPRRVKRVRIVRAGERRRRAGRTVAGEPAAEPAEPAAAHEKAAGDKAA
jgi:CBS domain containing-hemolysin-like protein